MAIQRVFNGAPLRKPGAYSRVETNLTGGFPIAATGVVAIIGEAEGGPSGALAGIQRFTSEDIAALAAQYKSGPIVDAARTLVAPTRDGRVVNGASQILVYKTNASTASSLTLQNGAAADLLDIESANFGEDENLISVTVSAGAVNVDARVLTVKKQSTTETLSENAHAVNMSLQYTGADASCTLQIQSNVLTLTTGSTPAEDISISLNGKTVSDVVELINANAAYSASTTLQSASFKAANELDPVVGADAKAASVDLYADQKELIDIITSESSLIIAEFKSNVPGQIAVSGQAFLTGGAKGATANSDFQTGFDALLGVRANTVVPLISRDASDLLAEGLTDPASTFTVDSVNLQALTHCITASNTKNRSERNAYVSHKGSFADSQQKAKTLNHERASMLFQDVAILDSSANQVVAEPWAAACICAGMQAGSSVGEPITFKQINALGISHADYNPRTQFDLAIDAGLVPLEELDSGGFRIVVGNTTYGKDADFVKNRISVLEAADTVAFNLRQNLESIFVGTKARTGSADAIKNTVVSVMSTFLNEEIIVGDDTNDGLGYKNLLVTIQGNTAFIDITITPVQGIDFVLSRIVLDDIRQSA